MQQEPQAIEPLKGWNGELIDTTDENALAESAAQAEVREAEEREAERLAAIAEEEGLTDDKEVPEALALGDTELLCVDIDQALDYALASDEEGLLLVMGDQPNPLVGRHLPKDLQGPGGSALPLVDGDAFLELWPRLEAHTEEHCGVPFFRTFMGTMFACLPTDDATPFPVDLGPCEDPRENPESIMSEARFIEVLRALGQTVKSTYVKID